MNKAKGDVYLLSLGIDYITGYIHSDLSTILSCKLTSIFICDHLALNLRSDNKNMALALSM